MGLAQTRWHVRIDFGRNLRGISSARNHAFLPNGRDRRSVAFQADAVERVTLDKDLQ